jgi:hypothetical protein
MVLPPEFVALTETGAALITFTSTPIPSPDSVLKKLASSAPTVLRNVALVDGAPAHISVAASHAVSWTTIPSLGLDTVFAVEKAGGKLVTYPAFAGSGTRQSFKWVPPEGSRLVVVASSSLDAQGVATYGETYLLLVGSPESLGKGVWALPLPNLFDDARVCTGEEKNTIAAAPTVVGQLAAAVRVIQTSVWNSDLLNGSKTERSKALFRFDTKTGEQLPVPETWPSLLMRVSCGVYNNLPLLTP